VYKERPLFFVQHKMMTPRCFLLAAILALFTSCASGSANSNQSVIGDRNGNGDRELLQRKLQNSTDAFITTSNSTLSSTVTADTNSSAGVEEHHDDEQDHDDLEKPWGPALLAALLVNVASLIGIVIVFITAVTAGRKGSHTRDFHGLLHICLPSFASGALLATSVFLIIPEAIHLLEGSHDEEDEHGAHRFLEEEESGAGESEVAWKFGAAVLGGYLLPAFIGSFFPHAHVVVKSREDPPVVTAAPGHDEENSSEQKDETIAGSSENNDGTIIEKQENPKKEINYRLAASLLIGDFFHNFADGIFIGNAFMLCDRSLAMTVAASTIFHELAQELADFTLLVHQCGFSPVWALVLNFVSGLSVMVGVIVILAVDVSPVATGSVLAVSAGVYLFIAAAECQPRVEKELHCFKDRMIAMVCFILGCIPIGLVLLKHKHCE
jgi:zinc transporter ZupT